MAMIQMWPQNQGFRNSVSFDGRTYSSTPGVSIPVSDFDVAVLQANGWTTYSTVAGKTTITMLPPANAVYNSITFNNRTYVTTPGVSIEAQPFDTPILQANGWTLVLFQAIGPVTQALVAGTSLDFRLVTEVVSETDQWGIITDGFLPASVDLGAGIP
jgi:hypothetical protein